jgi:hypothetical protein
MSKLLARVAISGIKSRYVELKIPKGTTARDFRCKIVEDEMPHPWLETVDGDLLNVSHILFLTLSDRR